MITVLTSSAAIAEEPPHPFGGRMYNTVENGWLTYECMPPEAGVLACDFVQTRIRQKLSASDAAKRLAKETQGWPEALAKEMKTTPERLYESGDWKGLCDMAQQGLSALNGSSSTEEMRKAVSRMSRVARGDLAAQMGAMGQACKTRTLDGMKRFMALGIDIEQRTCQIGTNSFKQTFKAVYASDGTFKSWNVADTTPNGDCGIINLSRFVPVPEKPGEKPYFWQYIARKGWSDQRRRRMSPTTSARLTALRSSI
ncbi:hypothetical protein VC290_20785, partial [Xanthomonas campestris]|uniref:hypothetical protein n=1 Tax=Xanthomonas campestris TaxID=339 RepID=UPI002B22BB21